MFCFDLPGRVLVWTKMTSKAFECNFNERTQLNEIGPLIQSNSDCMIHGKTHVSKWSMVPSVVNTFKFAHIFNHILLVSHIAHSSLGPNLI